MQRAADMLGITRQRVYAIIRDGGLATRNDTGKTLVSVESINERITANPKAGRRWQRP
ncbi:helix-turn-helix domain-containing protein [Gordonibacter sp.]|uniref:helix-turn-helix domain-containing protein n=1 Tax=Gordonibacter sp. TaxID=1968902 RepID=UPI003FA58300